jgi:carbon-monoxide dehydrogenase small subunit
VSAKKKYNFQVNGKDHSVETYPASRLLDVLRDDLRYTGCKEGCGEGECGTCSVFLDEVMVNSCLVPIAQGEGRAVRTVEALSEDPLGKILQRKFLEHNGAQCGICTPGMLIAAITLLRRNPSPTLSDIQDGLAGNLCRCTGYKKIFDAVDDAAKVARETGVSKEVTA